MSVTDSLVARGAPRTSLAGPRFEWALWKLDEGGFFRVTLQETPRPAVLRGAPPTYRWVQLIGPDGRESGPGVREGTLRTMHRCGLVRRRRGEGRDFPHHFLVTEVGERMAAERRAAGRYPWWRQPFSQDPGETDAPPDAADAL